MYDLTSSSCELYLLYLGFQDFNRGREQSDSYDEDMPSAPPLTGPFQPINQVSEKNPASRGDANTCSGTSRASESEVESNKNKMTMVGSKEVETPEVSERYIFGCKLQPSIHIGLLVE